MRDKHLAFLFGRDGAKPEEVGPIVAELLSVQQEQGIPLLSIGIADTALAEPLVAYLYQEQGNLSATRLLFFGHWYRLAPALVERMKTLVNRTKDHIEAYVNCFVAYDGREDVLNAVRFTLDNHEPLTAESVRSHLYASEFMPPSRMFVLGPEQKTEGFFFWDSPQMRVHFMQKFKRGDIEDVLKR